MNKPNKEILEKYKEKMKDALNYLDAEIGHSDCDDVLRELLLELGYDEVIKIYDKQTRYCA